MKVRNIKRAKLENLAKTVRLSLRFDGPLYALLRGMRPSDRERAILAALRRAQKTIPQPTRRTT